MLIETHCFYSGIVVLIPDIFGAANSIKNLYSGRLPFALESTKIIKKRTQALELVFLRIQIEWLARTFFKHS